MPSQPDPPADLTRAATPPQPAAARAPDGTALYVHVPFCVAKCPYCDFFSVEAEGQDLEGMVGSLLTEARARAPRHPDTVFLGGGTPSLLPEHLLAQLLDGLEDLTGFRSSAREVTAECNPESLDGPKAAALVDLGVSRLSLGMQSLDARTLEFFGRVHGPDDALRAFDAARTTTAQVSVDLIYAAPGQTPEAWDAELSRVLKLGPDHLSAYNLTFEEGTLFKVRRDRGEITPAPEEIELACFELARERSAQAGLEAYEISNYARPGCECQHNLTYWANGPYVGLGPGAVSKVGQTRSGNPRSLAPYVRWVAEAGHATLWREELEPLHRLGETWWLGLRRRIGVQPAEARAAAGLPPEEPDPATGVAERLGEMGLLELADGRWRLTRRGWPLADGVAREFLGLGD